MSQAELPALLRTAEALQVRGLADTTPNNNNFQSPPKSVITTGVKMCLFFNLLVFNHTIFVIDLLLQTFPQNFASNPQNSQHDLEDAEDETNGGDDCSSQNALNAQCDSSSAINACSNNASGKRSQTSPAGKNEEEESDSNDSQEFSGMEVMDDHLKQDSYMNDDGSLSQQFDDTTGIYLS